jgi:FkbM family methyltransferase
MNAFGPSAITTREKMAMARVLQLPVLAARRLSGRGPEVDARRRGIEWRLDLREGIDFSIWLRGSFEPSTIATYRRELRPGATAIDVGANVGSHTLELARAVGPLGRVLACEPTAHVFARLLANLEANPELRPRVHPDQVMLMAAAEAPLPEKLVSSWPLGTDPERDRTSWGRPYPTTGAHVSTMDRWVAERKVDRVDLVKIDVEGNECAVLDGAVDVMSRYRPVIVCEVFPAALSAAGRTVDELLERFDAAGYRLETLRGRPLARTAFERVERRGASTNVVARHPERPS